jgi:hypothetical protein
VKSATLEIHQLGQWAEQWAEHLPKLAVFIDEHGKDIDPDIYTALTKALQAVWEQVREVMDLAPEVPPEARGDLDLDAEVVDQAAEF